jgi:type IX secretion system PorP/SprF family membrane protein
MRSVVVIIFCLSVLSYAKAQERAILYSHHSFNGLAINPAYAGSHEMLNISLSHRSQWVGFEGAPEYNVFGMHTPFKNTRMGLGLLVMNESIGLRKFTGIYFNYAHRIELSRGKLALGLKGGIGTGNMKGLDLGDDDILFSENAHSYLLPNFGVGVYYYTKRFYAGFSVPLLLGYKSDAGDIKAYHDFNNYNYYFTTGVKLGLAPNWQIQPNALAEFSKSGGIVVDGGLGLLYKDILRVGASYRTKQAIIAYIDYKINYQLHIGVAYDYGIGEINEYNRSSYEIALEYNFGYRVKAANPTIF